MQMNSQPKTLLCVLLAAMCALGAAQGHNDAPKPVKINNLMFIVGEWSGKQTFHTDNGPMVADITDSATMEVGGRFIEERTTTKLPGGRGGSALHMLSYDPKTDVYKVWWFNDTSPDAQILKGTFDGTKLVLTADVPPDYKGPVLRAVYEKVSPTEMKYEFQMKNGESWRVLFDVDYTKKG